MNTSKKRGLLSSFNLNTQLVQAKGSNSGCASLFKSRRGGKA